jgi:AcrR family transcriptional regulator
VYRRYADREALALAVLFHDLQVRVADVAERVPHDLPLLDQLCELVRPIFGYYAEHPTVSAALLELAMFSTGGSRERLDAQLFEFLGGVALRAGEAQARGELDPDADLRALVSAFFALYVVTAVGGVRGLLPEVEQQLDAFRGMMAQQIRGAARPA